MKDERHDIGIFVESWLPTLSRGDKVPFVQSVLASMRSSKKLKLKAKKLTYSELISSEEFMEAFSDALSEQRGHEIYGEIMMGSNDEYHSLLSFVSQPAYLYDYFTED